jgi:hypothetical protein
MWLRSLGSNLKKTSEFEISLLELSQLPENKRNARIEHFYNQLKAALPPPEPYQGTRFEVELSLRERSKII